MFLDLATSFKTVNDVNDGTGSRAKPICIWTDANRPWIPLVGFTIQAICLQLMFIHVHQSSNCSILQHLDRIRGCAIGGIPLHG